MALLNKGCLHLCELQCQEELSSVRRYQTYMVEFKPQEKTIPGSVQNEMGRKGGSFQAFLPGLHFCQGVSGIEAMVYGSEVSITYFRYNTKPRFNLNFDKKVLQRGGHIPLLATTSPPCKPPPHLALQATFDTPNLEILPTPLKVTPGSCIMPGPDPFVCRSSIYKTTSKVLSTLYQKSPTSTVRSSGWVGFEVSGQFALLLFRTQTLPRYWHERRHM